MERKVYSLFAEILEYPTDSFYEGVDECISFLIGLDREAAGLLRISEPVLARMPLNQVQETYTRTFDLPDQLAVILRSLAQSAQGKEGVIEECLIPALEKILEGRVKGQIHNPYGAVLKALWPCCKK